jgi:site-specific DNA recombinase
MSNLPGGTIRAAGYVRVSTQDQVEHGLNLAEDRERIREKYEAEGWELVEVFDDGGLQGDDPNRPGLLALLDSLDRIDVVILRSIERLARDPMILGLATNAFRAAGVRLESFATGPIDIETPQGEFTSSLFVAMGKFEKRLTGQRVKQAMRARARAGDLPGGTAPYGYAWRAKQLVIVPAQAKVVRRVFDAYLAGDGQRAIVRALNEDKVPTALGVGVWQQSQVSRILGAVAYTGRMEFGGEVIPANHEPIVTVEVWERARAIRMDGSRSKGGRHAEGKHLLVRGMLRCSCGSAMIPRKARPGQERERYVCRGRIEHGSDFCSQPSIRRERVDAPLLATLLDGYVDFEATRQRIEDRAESVGSLAREARDQAETELASIDRRLARVLRGWQDDVIDDAEYARQRADLEAERLGAAAAHEQAQEHVEAVGQGSVPGDAEQALLDHLAALKQAVSGGVGSAPDLHALRNVIAELFESIQLVRSGTWPEVTSDGMIPWHDHVPAVEDGAERYWLLLKLRASSVDGETLKPIGQAMPVPVAQSYPPGFLARYCWW